MQQKEVTRAAVLPHEGAMIVGLVNKKEEIGRVLISEMLPSLRGLYSSLDEREISYAPIGSSLFGTKISVPEKFMQRRMMSALIDICYDGGRPELEAVVESSGWRRVDPASYFAITFQAEDGSRHTINTVLGQTMHEKEGLFLGLIPIPTTYYLNMVGRVKLSPFEKMPTPGEMVVRKIFRGSKQDLDDLANIAIAGNNLPALVEGRGEEVFLMEKGRREKSEGNAGWAISIQKRLNTIITSVIENASGNFNGVLLHNLNWLQDIKREVEALAMKAQKRFRAD